MSTYLGQGYVGTDAYHEHVWMQIVEYYEGDTGTPPRYVVREVCVLCGARREDVEGCKDC